LDRAKLRWIQSNEAINITFDAFLQSLWSKPTNSILSIYTGAWFYTIHNGDVQVILLFHVEKKYNTKQKLCELGIYNKVIENLS
jgi:hypothetical protein